MPWGDGQRFKNRTDAGRQLAEALAGVAFRDPVVLALPRGGVPVGVEIARRLGAPLDLLLVRKIGAPGNSEYAIGAVIEGSPAQRVIDENAVRYARASEAYIEAETQRQIDIIAKRREVYLSGRHPTPVEGRDVIIVDDGIATGSTVRAALKGLRGMGFASVTLAVPVAPISVVERLADDVDRLVCLTKPEDFNAVGEYYTDFRQLEDDEVIAQMAAAAQPARGTPSSRPMSS
jgi:putative phosphoribosyl transferase